MAQISINDIPTIDAAPFGNANFPDEFNSWLSNTVDVINLVFSLLSTTINNVIARSSVDIGGSGAGPIQINVTGLTASSVMTASIISSTNPVSIIAVTPGVDKFFVTFSGNPGASAFINYIIYKEATGS